MRTITELKEYVMAATTGLGGITAESESRKQLLRFFQDHPEMATESYFRRELARQQHRSEILDARLKEVMRQYGYINRGVLTFPAWVSPCVKHLGNEIERSKSYVYDLEFVLGERCLE